MTDSVPLLDVSDLTVEFSTRRGIVRAVQHVNVRIAKGETVGIVGESGSGKSVTSYAVMRILDRAGRIAEGAVHFTGLDIRAASEDQMRSLRGREMSMIFQNPRAALNPIRKVGIRSRTCWSSIRRRIPPRSRTRRSRSSTRCASPARASATKPIRSSSPAACASAW
jgi:ABC-type dipeptide/oligopeptide/nickel transport system ATPase component